MPRFFTGYTIIGCQSVYMPSIIVAAAIAGYLIKKREIRTGDAYVSEGIPGNRQVCPRWA